MKVDKSNEDKEEDHMLIKEQNKRITFLQRKLTDSSGSKNEWIINIWFSIFFFK